MPLSFLGTLISSLLPIVRDDFTSFGIGNLFCSMTLPYTRRIFDFRPSIFIRYSSRESSIYSIKRSTKKHVFLSENYSLKLHSLHHTFSHWTSRRSSNPIRIENDSGSNTPFFYFAITHLQCHEQKGIQIGVTRSSITEF